VLRPNKKPDIDNVVKIIADSLNEIAYKDDTQIVEVVASKYYSDKPRVEVILEDIS
ncbi:RusA family crossover junction endodeoxyribonuclease, partial [Clostridioides difficile]|nr:RusA family crossover junction endodeoxyribonuclease [Clostridioides difficile]